MCKQRSLVWHAPTEDSLVVGPSGLFVINKYWRQFLLHAWRSVGWSELGVTSSVSISLLCRRGDDGVGKSVNKATGNSQSTLYVLHVAYFTFVRKTEACGITTLCSTHPFQFFKQSERCRTRVHSSVVIFSFPAVSSINMADSRTSEMGTALAPLQLGSWSDVWWRIYNKVFSFSSDEIWQIYRILNV